MVDMTFREKAREDLSIIKKVLEENNVKFFLIWGTCLGAVREEDFILYDKDIDLAIIEETVPLEQLLQEICKDLRDKSFEVSFFRYELSARLRAVRKTVTDIHWFENIEGNFILRAPPNGRVLPLCRVPERFWRKFREAKLGNESYLVPDPPELYLEWKYGKNWRTPGH